MPLPLAGQSLQPDVVRGGDARGRPAVRAPPDAGPGSQHEEPPARQPPRGAAGPGSQHEEPQARAASTRQPQARAASTRSRRREGRGPRSRRMTGARNGRRGIVINRLVSCQRHQTVDHERGAQAVRAPRPRGSCQPRASRTYHLHPPVIMGLVGPERHQSHDHEPAGGRARHAGRQARARSPGPGVPARRTGGQAGAGRRAREGGAGGGPGLAARGSRLAARGSRLAARGSAWCTCT